MSETALNLLAIAIFAITMISLSTPFTGISPLIPTGIAVLFLGLYGLDNAYAEGKGGTKIINWVESKLPSYKAKQARILYHEAGHFLAAHILGIKVVGYNLKAQAGVEVDTTTDMNTMPLNILERYCTVWMAGIAAEEYIYQTAEGGDDDLFKLRAAIAHTANPDLEERWAKVRARNLIRVNATAFAALVSKMQEQSTVEACYAAIDVLAIREL